jgi:hypothetical protein
MPKKNPIFSKKRIFDGASMPKKIRFFQTIGFLTEHLCQKKSDSSKGTNF